MSGFLFWGYDVKTNDDFRIWHVKLSLTPFSYVGSGNEPKSIKFFDIDIFFKPKFTVFYLNT